eukprot:6205559-Ditylum_brightwellii.AAC.1
MMISNYFESHHFGKSLLPKLNTHLPRNYIAVNGQSNKELPEWALTTKCMAHIHLNVVKLPMDCGAIQSHTVPSSNQPPSPYDDSKKEESWTWKQSKK